MNWEPWSEVVAAEESRSAGRLFPLWLRAGAVSWPDLPVPLTFASRVDLEEVTADGFYVDEDQRMVVLRLPETASGELVAGSVTGMERRDRDLVASGEIHPQVRDLLDRNAAYEGREVAYSLALGGEPPIDWEWNAEKQRMEVVAAVLRAVHVFVDGKGLR